MNKRKTKKIMRDMIRKVPKEMPLKDYVFCSSREFDYGGKVYKGIDLHYFNIIKKGVIYLISKKNYEDLYI